MSMKSGPSAEILGVACRRYYVRRNRFAYTASAIIMINLLSAPMKTYLTESFPWSLQTHSSMKYSNFATWNASTIAMYQAIETQVPQDHFVYHNSASGMLIIRHHITSLHQVVFIGMPGAIFYGAAMRSILCNIAHLNDTNELTINSMGTCMLIDLFGYSFGEQCLWFTSREGKTLINFACTIYPTILLGWFTFAFRIATTLYMSLLLWNSYYKHVYLLEQQLSQFGHHRCMNSDKTTYELIIGDPTAPLLMHSWITFALSLDIWFGLGENCIAMLLTSQNDDISSLLTSSLYLSRMVWNAFLIMCLTKFLLKRFALEHTFVPLDPTYVAIIVGIYSPAFAWICGNIPCILKICHFLIECMVPVEKIDNHIDVALFILFYFGSIGILPVLYGRLIPQWNSTKVVPPDHNFASSFRYNNVKNRAFLSLTGATHYKKKSNVVSLGGTIYMLLVANPRYIRYPTLCCRGADCYILCIHDKLLSEKIRISLLKLFDTTLRANKSTIQEATFSTLFIVNQLHIQPKTLPSFSKKQIKSKREKTKPNKVAIVKSTIATAWCM